MASYNIKHIEYLRQKANLTYEQAINLLDRNGGDVTQALIELERNGTLNMAAATQKQQRAQYSDAGKPRSAWDNIVDVFIKGLRLKLVVERDDHVIVSLPVIYLALGVLMSYKFAILSVILMFVTGCRVHLQHMSDPEGDRRIRRYARGAEKTVRKKMSEVSEQSDDDDYGSYTAE